MGDKENSKNGMINAKTIIIGLTEKERKEIKAEKNRNPNQSRSRGTISKRSAYSPGHNGKSYEEAPNNTKNPINIIEGLIHAEHDIDRKKVYAWEKGNKSLLCNKPPADFINRLGGNTFAYIYILF